MTQHRWKTTDGYEAMAGWDRPLKYFFLQISKECECEDDVACQGRGEIFVYDNLDDPKLIMGGMTLGEVGDRLDQYLTAYPVPLLAQLAEDRAQNAGNLITEWPTTGTVRTG